MIVVYLYNGEFNLNIITNIKFKEYIFNNITKKKYSKFIQKYIDNIITDDEIGILLGFHCKYPSMLNIRFGYSFNIVFENKKIQIIAFLCSEKLSENYFFDFIKSINKYNEEFNTNYGIIIDENIRYPIKYYLEKLKNKNLTYEDINTISNTFNGCKAKSFSKLLKSLRINIFKDDDIIDLIYQNYSTLQIDIYDQPINISSIDKILCNNLLDIILS